MEKFIDGILKLSLRSSYLSSLRLVSRITRCKQFDDTVSDINLVIQIALLQFINLPVEFGSNPRVGEFFEQIAMQERTVERTYHVEPYARCIGWIQFNSNALRHLARTEFSLVNHIKHRSRVVNNGTLPYSVNAAQDVHIGLQLPCNMLASLP